MQTGSENTATLQALRDFVANPDLAELQRLIAEQKSQPGEFDLFEVIRPRLWEYEDVHSNVLAWLLNPSESHGVGDYFLRNFLMTTVTQAESRGIGTAASVHITKADWSDTAVHRERNYIDILLVNRSNGLACAIENKIFAPEGIDSKGYSQLTWYREVLERDYPTCTRHHVFLSPQGTLPAQDKERGFWIPENYTTVRQLVKQTLASNADSIGEDVRVFLRQYATMLRRKIVPELGEVQQLARQIYLQNRDVMERISQYKPDYAAETRQQLIEAVQQQGWEIDLRYGPYFRFRPRDWDNYSALETGREFSGSKALLRFQFGNDNDSTTLQLALYHGDDESIRRSIYEYTRKYPELFNEGASEFQENVLVLHTRTYRLEEWDLANWDDPSVMGKIMAWVVEFAENEFPAMNEVIIKCLREYEAEQARL